MIWPVDLSEGVATVRMNSNRVNAQNPAFFEDLMRTFDRLDAEFPRLPVVLTGTGTVFSAGIDFEHSFPLFRRKTLEGTVAWFAQFRGAMLRVFESERPMVAAVNGHAYAGGLILALCCDFRIAADGDFHCGLNEVPLGIPMPSVYTELIRFRLGTAVASEAILTGRTYTQAEALRAGFYEALVPPEILLEAARERARCVPPACLEAYTHSKAMLVAPILQRIQQLSNVLDVGTAEVISHDELLGAQERALSELKRRKPGR